MLTQEVVQRHRTKRTVLPAVLAPRADGTLMLAAWKVGELDPGGGYLRAVSAEMPQREAMSAKAKVFCVAGKKNPKATVQERKPQGFSVSGRWRIGVIWAFCGGPENRPLFFPLQVLMKRRCSAARLTTVKG